MITTEIKILNYKQLRTYNGNPSNKNNQETENTDTFEQSEIFSRGWDGVNF